MNYVGRSEPVLWLAVLYVEESKDGDGRKNKEQFKENKVEQCFQLWSTLEGMFAFWQNAKR